MEHVQWLPVFETGIPNIDIEHRRIFDLVQELFDALREDDVNRCKALAGVIVDRAEEHFAVEEWYLQAHAFPGLASHRRYHRHLVDHGRALADDVTRCRHADDLRPLCDAFLSFIIDDIIKGDMVVKSHVQAETPPDC